MSVLNQSGEDAVDCPLCMEPLEVDDLNFFPCTCGYQICRFCWHRIRTDENGLCPACRKAYSENPADFKPLTKEEISRLKAEKRLKDQQRKQRVTENRKHLANVRVVQKNLVFVVGLPMRLADADVLKKHEYFGKFGKIHKVVINQSTSYAGSQGPSASAYVTYQRQEDALRAIEAVNNIIVDGRTIKTSLGTTKYCSHFMRNQCCPKPDCMYLHDLGEQEASFTKEEMHQGKHQEYERKLVQSLHANALLAVNRKPTPTPPVTGTTIRENGVAPNPQTKEAWPSLQPGQTTIPPTNSKDPSPPTQQQPPPLAQSNGSVPSAGVPSAPANNTTTQQQNNNNKGEGISGNSARRGKSNSESKAQAVRNKHKNTQNKEKHGATSTTSSITTATTTTTTTTTRTTSKSESSSSNGIGSDKVTQIDEQKDIKCYNDGQSNSLHSDGSANDSSCKDEQGVQLINNHHRQRQNSDTAKTIEQSMRDIKLNGVVTRSCDQSESESEQQREGSTPASTASSSSDDSGCNIGNETVNPSEDSCDPIILANVSADWSATTLASIPDSLPSVHSSEDWQAAFGFQPEKQQPPQQHHTTNDNKISPPSTPSTTPVITTYVPFDTDNFLVSEDYVDKHHIPLSSSSKLRNDFDPSIIMTSSASKFMADFQQNSLQARLSMQAQQNQENCQYIKQNGHGFEAVIKSEGNDLKVDDDLGFDPFHETQKALAELMENEMQLQQQRLSQQQRQQQHQQHQQQQQQQNHHNHRNNHFFHNHQNQSLHQRERGDETTRNHQNLALGPHPFGQVTQFAHLHQAHQLQNIQVLQQQQQQQQQSHSLLSRLPQNMIASNQSPVQPNSLASIGQRSRLPPPGFPGSTPNHMNSFGLGIPRPAPTNQPSQQTSYLPNGSPLLASQNLHKCSNEAVYGLKDWCEINGQQQPAGHPFNHQPLHQKGWNNFGSIADWTSIDPAIVSSSRPVPFQTTSTWQFPRIHPPSHTVPHNGPQEQNAPTQHWAMQPPPGFGGPSSTQMNGQPSGTAAQPHSKLISAGPEIENL